jgi:hypothetical protein
MPEWLQQTLPGEAPVGMSVLMTRLGVALGLGFVAAAIHAVTAGRPSRRTDGPLRATLVLLSVLIALVTLVIGNSVARAFSLVGALAIVRFRTVVEDLCDTAFVLYAVVAGMAAGTGYAVGPLACAPLVLAAAWVFRPYRDRPPAAGGTLVLRLPAGGPPDERVEAVLQKHLRAHRLVGLSTARGGSAMDASYAVRLPPAEEVFALVTELNRLEGVQSVELTESDH